MHTSLFTHQKEALAKANGSEYFAYLMEMGTGKSCTAITEAAELFHSGKISGILIAAPKGVYNNWLSSDLCSGQLSEHMPESIKKNARYSIWSSGLNKKQREIFAKRLLFPHDHLDVLLINIESLSSIDMLNDICLKFLKSKPCLMIIDESTTIKNRQATRTKKIINLGKFAKYRRILTGSPITKSPEDIYSQFEFLKKGLLGHWSYRSFVGEFCVTRELPIGPGGRYLKVVVGHRNLERLSDIVNKYSFRIKKEDCLDLPPKVYVKRTTYLTEEQKKAYNDMRTQALFELSSDSMSSTTHVTTQILRLHQIVCGHIKDDDGNIHDLPSLRMQSLLDILEETSEQKIIIWANYRRDIFNICKTITKEFGKDSFVEFHGGVEQHQREISIEKFQENNATRFFIGNTQTAGRGITLTKASVVIYYSNNWDLEQRLQSEDRAHRIGQKNSVTYIDIVAENTIDEKILKALRNKMDLVQCVLRDGAKDWI